MIETSFIFGKTKEEQILAAESNNTQHGSKGYGW